jgi:tetratricopeptide (TPR) repeat protein
METEPTAALQDFEQALKLNPRSREALINKSIVLSEYLKRPREAVVVFDRFLEYYPDHVAARLGRGVILARLGECERARRDAEESLERDRSPFFLFQAAGLYAQIAQYEKGDDAKKEALALLGSALRKGFADLELFKTDADLNPIRGEAEFKRLLEIATGLK